MTDSTSTVDRRTVMKLLGATGLTGMSGYAGATQTNPDATSQQKMDQSNTSSDDGTQMQMFEQIPAIDLPVIDGYHDGEKVWFIHTSASSEKMAKRLTEMVNYRTLHVPKLNDIVETDALADIYVFKKGSIRATSNRGAVAHSATRSTSSIRCPARKNTLRCAIPIP